MYVNAAKATKAAEVLDIDMEELTEVAITKAYRAASKACHPDSGKHDPALWQRISWAKTILHRWLELRKNANAPVGGAKGSCRACTGQGFIQRRTGFALGPRMMCVMCHGSGNPKKPDRDE